MTWRRFVRLAIDGVALLVVISFLQRALQPVAAGWLFCGLIAVFYGWVRMVVHGGEKEFTRGYLLALDHAHQQLAQQAKRDPLTLPKSTNEIFDSLRREARDG